MFLNSFLFIMHCVPSSVALLFSFWCDFHFNYCFIPATSGWALPVHVSVSFLHHVMAQLLHWGSLSYFIEVIASLNFYALHSWEHIWAQLSSAFWQELPTECSLFSCVFSFPYFFPPQHGLFYVVMEASSFFISFLVFLEWAIYQKRYGWENRAGLGVWLEESYFTSISGRDARAAQARSACKKQVMWDI